MKDHGDEGAPMARWRTRWRSWLALLCAATLMVLAATPASAADPAPCRVRNVTQETSGRSLRQMVERAKDGDRLRVHGTCTGGVTLGKDITLLGVGPQRPTLTGRGRYRVLKVLASATVVLRRLVIADGHQVERRGSGVLNRGVLRVADSVIRHNLGLMGGGVENFGTLTIVDSTVARNTARIGVGGGVLNHGALTVTASVVSRNRAGGSAGAIANDGTARVIDSLLRRNHARNGGGAITNSGGSLLLTRSEVQANEARRGGGIWTSTVLGPTSVTLEDSSISGNIARRWAGGIENNGGTVTLTGSSVTGNSAQRGAGGILNLEDGTVTLDASSSVTGNTPDDCVGC